MYCLQAQLATQTPEEIKLLCGILTVLASVVGCRIFRWKSCIPIKELKRWVRKDNEYALKLGFLTEDHWAPLGGHGILIKKPQVKDLLTIIDHLKPADGCSYYE